MDTYTPLNGSEISRISVFLLILALSVGFFGMGLLPLLMLFSGLFLTRRTGDFVNLSNAVRNVKIFFFIPLVIAWLVVLIDPLDELVWLGAVCMTLVIGGLYVGINPLFYAPLLNHKEWVLKNGVFANQERNLTKMPRVGKVKKTEGQVDADEQSISDELVKLSSLLSTGVISEDEFKQAKAKLLAHN